MFLTAICIVAAILAVWLLSNWRVALIWSITVGLLIFTQGYFTYVLMAAGSTNETSL